MVETPAIRLARNFPACIATGVSSGLPSIMSPIANMFDMFVASPTKYYFSMIVLLVFL